MRFKIQKTAIEYEELRDRIGKIIAEITKLKTNFVIEFLYKHWPEHEEFEKIFELIEESLDAVRDAQNISKFKEPVSEIKVERPRRFSFL